MFLRRPYCLAVWILAGSLLAGGCSHEQPASSCAELLVPVHQVSPADVFCVPGNAGWVCTPIEVQTGEAITVTADGLVQFRDPACCDRDRPCQAGPEGLYLYHDDVAFQNFPLPSAAGGPAPCYCLMGRIGDGPAFFIGRAKSWIAQQSGPLWLGVNDFDYCDNAGQFAASVTKPEQPQPIALQEVVPPDAIPGSPVAGAQVIVFYIDGLASRRGAGDGRDGPSAEHSGAVSGRRLLAEKRLHRVSFGHHHLQRHDVDGLFFGSARPERPGPLQPEDACTANPIWNPWDRTAVPGCSRRSALTRWSTMRRRTRWGCSRGRMRRPAI